MQTMGAFFCEWAIKNKWYTFFSTFKPCKEMKMLFEFLYGLRERKKEFKTQFSKEFSNPCIEDLQILDCHFQPKYEVISYWSVWGKNFHTYRCSCIHSALAEFHPIHRRKRTQIMIDMTRIFVWLPSASSKWWSGCWTNDCASLEISKIDSKKVTTQVSMWCSITAF